MDTTVASGARSKRTKIYGKGKDTVTLMVYMCGTDLESRSAMATKDLVEMTNAKLGDNVRILVYTGGCTKWNNNVISSQYNQIYEVKSGGLQCLVSNAGTASMTSPDTLSGFIQWCAKNYPARTAFVLLSVRVAVPSVPVLSSASTSNSAFRSEQPRLRWGCFLFYNKNSGTTACQHGASMVK